MAECCFSGRGLVSLTAPLVDGGNVSLTEFDGASIIAANSYGLNASGVLKMPPGQFLGNCAEVKLETEINSLSGVPNFTNDGGSVCSASEVTDVNISLNVACFSPKNLALLFGGTISSQGAQAAGNDAFYRPTTAGDQPAGTFLHTTREIDLTKAVTVNFSYGSTTPRHVLTAFGIHLLDPVANGASFFCQIVYTAKAETPTVEMNQKPGFVSGFSFAGMNKFGNGSASLKAYRVLWEQAKNLDIISDGATLVALSGKLLSISHLGSQKRAQLWGFA
jgi:hypothetical protein